MFYLRDAANNIQKIGGFPSIIVHFRDGENKLHEQNYLIDGDFRQKYFMNMLRAAQVPMVNGTPKKSDAVGKRLWGAVQECHFIEDDVAIIGPDGKAKIEYYLFKVYPFIEGGKKPSIKGDPAMNNGIAEEPFITYRNLSKEAPADQIIQREEVIAAVKPIATDYARAPKEEKIKITVAKKKEEEIEPSMDDVPDFGEVPEEPKQEPPSDEDEMPVF